MPGVPELPRTSFQILFESAPGLYVVLDPDLRVVAVTDAWLSATLATREQIVGRHLLEAMPDNPDDPDATGTANLSASLHRVLDRREADTMAVQQYDVDDGSGSFVTRYWSPRNSPILDPDGRAAYIIHQAEDVTEFVTMQEHGEQQTDELIERTRQMQAEILRRSQELHEANRALRAADNAKNDFLSRVSHELRTPLNAILGFSELLGLSEIDEGHREWAGLIHSAGHHLLALLDDVLDIARIEGGHLALTLVPVPVGPLVTEVLDLVRPIADAKAVRLTPAPQIPPDWCVLADRQRLRQVLMNLLSNAIKFNHPTGTVTVTARQESAQRIRIAVTDTGRGIPEQFLPALFTPFERLDAAKAGFEGTGLGLSLSRHLVSTMQGRLDVTSEHGKGSTFWVDLPSGTSTEAGGGDSRRTGIPPPSGHARPARVLYVEDVADNVRLVEDILVHRPMITLAPVTLAATAFDLAREQRPDLILLDLHLPDMAGEDLFHLLRAEPLTRDIPVVAFSADATAATVARLRAAGVAAYLTKPVAVRDVLTTLDRLLPTVATAPGARPAPGAQILGDRSRDDAPQ